jgi:hypothetical protein
MAGQLLLVNPRGRKRRAAKKVSYPRATRTRRARRAAARRRSGLFKNPIGRALRLGGGGLVSGIGGQVMGAGVGLAGAVGTDVLFKFLPLTLKTGALSHLIRAALAITLGLVGKRKPLIVQAAHGALTIALYRAYMQYAQGPLNLGELSDGDMYQLADMYSNGDGGVGAFMGPPGLGTNTPALGAYELNDSEYV